VAATESGMVDYVTKPIDMQTLHQLLVHWTAAPAAAGLRMRDEPAGPLTQRAS
jgi:response regulator of citrate/malate metabolism